MQLVKIDDNVLVNPDMIECIEFKRIDGKKVLVVMINGRQYIASVKVPDLLSDLIKAGMTANDQFFTG